MDAGSAPKRSGGAGSTGRLHRADAPGRVIGPFSDELSRPIPRDPVSIRFHDAIATAFASPMHRTPEEAGELIRIMGLQADRLGMGPDEATAFAEGIASQAGRR